ncbi:MAG: TPM domain-containing protein [Pseudomonadota bacterium]
MNLNRVLKHLIRSPWAAQHIFSKNILEAIDTAIHKSEILHTAEIRFVVEDNLDIFAVLQDQTARQRAIEVFSDCRLWDTEHNNGVLIYVLLADKDVEIVVDRGVKAVVETKELERICHYMEDEFKNKRFKQGVIIGIEELTQQVIKHFPANGVNPNELPNKPVIL